MLTIKDLWSMDQSRFTIWHQDFDNQDYLVYYDTLTGKHYIRSDKFLIPVPFCVINSPQLNKKEYDYCPYCGEKL